MSDPAHQSDGNRKPELSGDQVLAFVFVGLALLVVVGGVAVYHWSTAELDAPPAAMHFRVPINTAHPATLELLPGIGPALAKRIVEARKRRPFSSVEDLERVKGIGAKTSQRMAPFVIFATPEPEPIKR